jgi:hypothetical protein
MIWTLYLRLHVPLFSFQRAPLSSPGKLPGFFEQREIVTELELPVKPFFSAFVGAGDRRRPPPAASPRREPGKLGGSNLSGELPLPSLAARRDITLFSPGVNTFQTFFSQKLISSMISIT